MREEPTDHDAVVVAGLDPAPLYRPVRRAVVQVARVQPERTHAPLPGADAREHEQHDQPPDGVKARRGNLPHRHLVLLVHVLHGQNWK